MDQKILTVGFAVYNGEKFLKRRLDNILTQSYNSFLIIISDNASTDKTQEICKEYQKNDPRVTYVRQDKNLGGSNNFLWLINNSNTEYCVLAAVDDFWSQNFLENNIKNLQNNSDSVGSIGNVYYFDDERFSMDTFDKNSYTKQHVRSTDGTYEQRLQKYVNFNQTSALYSIFRTNILKKSVVQHAIVAWDTALIFRALKYGNFIVDQQSSMYRFSKGTSSVEELLSYKFSLSERKISFFEAMLTFLPFTIISLKAMGIRIFLKNFEWFLLLNFRGERRFLKDLIKNFSQKNF